MGAVLQPAQGDEGAADDVEFVPFLGVGVDGDFRTAGADGIDVFKRAAK